MLNKTVVVFRKFKNNGAVIALFTEEPATLNPLECSSYMRVGQHGAANPFELACMTVIAKEKEYKNLEKELITIGYDLDIRKRITASMLAERNKKIEEFLQK